MHRMSHPGEQGMGRVRARVWQRHEVSLGMGVRQAGWTEPDHSHVHMRPG